MEQERRQWTRTRPTQLMYVELGTDNGGMVLDISETGIGFCAVSAVAGGEKITFVFTADGERRLKGSAESAWTDVTGKIGGLRFLEVSDEFRRELHNWLRGNTVPVGSVTQHVAAATTPKERMGQPPRGPLRELLKPAEEGQSKTLRANAMRIAADANVLRVAGAMFVVMLVMILFLFRQGVGEGLVWLGKKIAGEPRALPIQLSDGQVQRPSPMADTSKVDTHKEQESGVVKKSVLAPLSTTVPGHIVAPARTAQPTATGKFLGGMRPAVKKGNSEAGSHPGPIRPKVVREDKAETVRLLWAEVTRGEISAEVTLADMYVHGDRVPRNCAQARVLLSAAAKRGNEIAVRKLIDLDSEGGGCSSSAPQ